MDVNTPTYATVVRGTGDNIGDQPVFATPGDEELRHTTINQWLQSTWRKSGMLLKFPEFHFSLTMNRKRLTGVERREDMERAPEMASYMKHNLSTADKHYVVHHQLTAFQKICQWLDSIQKGAASAKKAPAKKMAASATAPNPEAFVPLPPAAPEQPMTDERRSAVRRRPGAATSHLWCAVRSALELVPVSVPLPSAAPVVDIAPELPNTQTALQTGLADYLVEIEDALREKLRDIVKHRKLRKS